VGSGTVRLRRALYSQEMDSNNGLFQRLGSMVLEWTRRARGAPPAVRIDPLTWSIPYEELRAVIQPRYS
jgi:hypothetical protein